ncbi:MAG TPA: NERD domain-containing protein [Cerasibacillus sp.]|uniref:NERD domain-containing protein n=1 Tax=Cerasibacillus sp. TaxID=2498711 RepID=UPI002F3FE8E2
MAQLIKLYDYISRYEWNMYRYPTQYIRLKQDKWEKIYERWQEQGVEDRKPQEKNERGPKLKWFSKTKKKDMQENHQIEIPKTEQRLKQAFLDRLYRFQLKWASSTISDMSLIDEKIYEDETLKYFLQRFPDNYFLLYYPVFAIKNAPIDGEIIFISPLGIEIIHLLETATPYFYVAGDERFWIKEKNRKQKHVLSPLIPLKRTEQIIKSILKQADVDFPVQKVVLSETNHIICQAEPYQTRIIGKSDYPKWFEEKRVLSAPLKGQQLKATEVILKHCQSLSFKRPEWEEETDSFSFTDEV